MDLAIDLYKQMGTQGLPRDRQSFQLLVDVYVKARPLPPAARPQSSSRLSQRAQKVIRLAWCLQLH